MRINSILAAAMIAIALPAAASANTAPTFTKQVSLDDLDLTTTAGVALLDQRVKTLIRRECASGGRDRESLRAEEACRAAAYANAENAIRFAVAKANADKVRLAADTPAAPEA